MDDFESYYNDIPQKMDIVMPHIATKEELKEIKPIITRGKGGQTNAYNLGAKILFHINPRADSNYFMGFATAEEVQIYLPNFITKNPTVEIIEKIQGNNPGCLTVDIDCSNDKYPVMLTDDDITIICNKIMFVANSFGYTRDVKPCRVFKYFLKDKHSCHIHANFGMESGKLNRWFVTTVVDLLRSDGYDNIANMIDVLASGNDKSYSLRLPFVPKVGDRTKILLPSVEHNTKADISDIMSYTITCDDNITILSAPIEWFGNSDEPMEDIADAIVDKDFINNFIVKVKTEFIGIYEYDTEFVSDGKSIANFNRVNPRYCHVCDRIHDRLGAVIKISKNGSLYFNCRAAMSSGGEPLMQQLAKTKYIKIETPPDEYDFINNDNKITVGTQSIESTESTEMIEDKIPYCLEVVKMQNDDLYLQSSWGAGKTTYYIEKVKLLLKTNPNAKILVISSRRSLSAQLNNDFKAVCDSVYLYSDKENNKSRKISNKQHSIIIVQIDSIGRLDLNNKNFDLIVMDEFAQLISHAYQANHKNGEHTRISDITQLKHLIIKADQILTCDNDLTSAHIDAIRKLRIDKPYRIVENVYKPWKHIKPKIYTGDHKYLRTLLIAHIKEQNNNRLADKPYTGTVICCHSKKLANSLNLQLRDEIKVYYDSIGQLYTSESDPVVKSKAFENANESFVKDKPLFIIYTNCVSVGVSCNSEYFTDSYGFFNENNASAAQSTQMLFRCRKIQNISIAYSGGCVYNCATTPINLSRWVVKSRNNYLLPNEFRSNRNCAIDPDIGDTQTDPNALLKFTTGIFEGNLWICNQLEINRSANDFIGRVTKILTRAGMVCETIESPDMRKTINTAYIYNAQYICHREEQAIGNVQKAIAIMSDASANNVDVVNNPYVVSSKLVYTAGVYGVDINKIECNTSDVIIGPDENGKIVVSGLDKLWFNYYEPYRAGYQNLQKEYHNISNYAESNSISSQLEASLYARNVIEELGGNLSDEIVNVQKSIIENPTDKLLKLLNSINTNAWRVFADNKGNRRLKGSTNKTIVSTLNVALKQFAAKLVIIYASSNDKKQGKASGYKIIYPWHTTLNGTIETPPDPKPMHILDRQDKQNKPKAQYNIEMSIDDVYQMII